MTMKGRNIHKILLGGLAMLLALSCSKRQEGAAGQAASGQTIVETGELAAVNSKSFVLPRYGRYWYQMRVIGLLEHGAIVNPGDSIIQLDPTEIQKFIVDRESNLETEHAALEKLIVNDENKINDLLSRIKSEESSLALKKIELESSRFESDRYKKIKDLEYKQAQILFAKEQKKLELMRKIVHNDLKIQQVRIRQIENEINNAYDILPQLTIRTPIAGVFQIAHNYRTNALVKVGDNIYQGNNLANVPELKWMKVNTFINENDFLKIHVGQPVAVRLDALPKVIFEGKIAYIGKLCHLKDPKSKQKVFDVEVNLKEPDQRLKPGMTVSCEFLEDK